MSDNAQPDHFTGRLACFETWLVSEDGPAQRIATTSPGICSPGMKSALANAWRIRRCWNGCIGIANPEAVPELLRYAELEEEYREAANSRDHKQKLHEMRRRHGVDDETPIPHWIAGIRSSAIAKAKGGAA